MSELGFIGFIGLCGFRKLEPRRNEGTKKGGGFLDRIYRVGDSADYVTDRTDSAGAHVAAGDREESSGGVTPGVDAAGWNPGTSGARTRLKPAGLGRGGERVV